MYTNLQRGGSGKRLQISTDSTEFLRQSVDGKYYVCGPENGSRKNAAVKDVPILVVFWQREAAEIARLPPSPKIYWPKPNWAFYSDVFEDRRARDVFIVFKLITIHPNPGPRDKSEEALKLRCKNRYKKRQEKRSLRQKQDVKKKEGKKDDILKIVSWNVQRMGLGRFNKRKARAVTTIVNRNGWDIIMLSEVNAENDGVEYFGSGENLTAVIHSKRAGIMLRGKSLQRWIDEGQPKLFDSRTVSVRFSRAVFTSTYQPVWSGDNQADLDAGKQEILKHKKWARGGDVTIVGGDFNAHIGGNERRPGTCGIFGLRETNYPGSELLQFCEENGLCYVNSFYNYGKRGTWFSNFNHNWYELDGFLMRKEQRHKNVVKMKTVQEASISDHKPKIMYCRLFHKKYSTHCKVKTSKKIRWEKLNNDDTAKLFKCRVEEYLDDMKEEDAEMTSTNWDMISNTLNNAATEVCGVQEKKIENPWLEDKDDEIIRMRDEITKAVNEKNDLLQKLNDDLIGLYALDANEDLSVAIEDLKSARKALKSSTARWEREWWQQIITECEKAAEVGNSREVYSKLKILGKRDIKTARTNTNITKDEFKLHFQKVSEERFENDQEDIEKYLDENVEDISDSDLAREWRDILEDPPSKEEIKKQMDLMKESAPGNDNTRLIYIRKAGPRIFEEIVKLVNFMFENPAEKWEDSLKLGLVIPLHKKGDKDNPNNFRGVCLLSMGSRILARIMADRLRIWSEKMMLLDDNQAGFRKGRATADVTQVMLRIWEDTVDLKKRMLAQDGRIDEERLPEARLLDLRKAYPRVNKHALWIILKKYGIGEKCLRVLQDLHESTSYRIKSNEGLSDSWIPLRGLREGCPSSPPTFNIFHQVPMRVAGIKRKAAAIERDGEEPGITFSYVPGSNLPSGPLWEKYNSESKKARIDNQLFADDTTGLGRKKEIDEGIMIVKQNMAEVEEKNNEDKEEKIDFGEDEGGKIRVLGSYLCQKEDIKQRLKRANFAWYKVRRQLKGSKMTKQSQARVVQAVCESTLLFDVQVRVWETREIKKLQSCMDRMYRYIWSSKTMPPLKQMQEEHKNMQDVRNYLKVKSVRSKIEKRVLERIGHVMRLEDDSIVKIATLGWLTDLESYAKIPGKKKKTLLYWKRIVKEAGIDYTKINQLTSDRKAWRSIVKERVKHIQEWERKGGHQVQGERGDRNVKVESDLICSYCDKVCSSKAGLTVHVRRIHEQSSHKKFFNCDKCELKFPQEANLLNHKKFCGGGVASSVNMRKCDNCGNEVSKANFARHRKQCVGVAQFIQQSGEQVARVYKSDRTICNLCGVPQAKTNLSRHQKKCLAGRAVH